METSLFSFNLPEELIAKEPPRVRGTCRLMLLPSGGRSAQGGARSPRAGRAGEGVREGPGKPGKSENAGETGGSGNLGESGPETAPKSGPAVKPGNPAEAGSASGVSTGAQTAVLDPAAPNPEEPGDFPPPIHTAMPYLPDFIEPGTVMVFNDTRVRKARMFARNAQTGGRGEFLFIQCTSGGQWDCVVDKARRKKTGQLWAFPGGVEGRITGAPAPDRRLVTLSPQPEENWFETYGHIPLPPYMRREDTSADARRYQTVYARNTGSAAAPTAGLHFTESILRELEAKGVEIRWVTLEVGLGTFAPVRSRLITGHEMHTERYFVPEETARAVNRAKREGRPVLAVGTTSVRTLESAWQPPAGSGFPDSGLRSCGQLRPGSGSTRLFIYPGYRFQAVDRIFTNFHTPRSTLLMMISAFCGRERILRAYEEAVALQYRFFSYGDAMLIH